MRDGHGQREMQGHLPQRDLHLSTHLYLFGILKNDTFKTRVFAVTAGIPRGETLSYAQVAALAGSPNASRAVGNILTTNRDPNVPCHRVIRADGSVGGYAWGTERKTAILKSEGAIA